MRFKFYNLSPEVMVLFCDLAKITIFSGLVGATFFIERHLNPKEDAIEDTRSESVKIADAVKIFGATYGIGIS